MSSQEFECLEPELQAKVAQHALEELDPVTRKHWERHLEICHACRENQQMEKAIGELIAKGVGVPMRERLHPVRLGQSWGRRRPRTRVLGAGLAAAAGLILAIALPPAEGILWSAGHRITKSDADASFTIERPHEGEILYLTGGDLEWSSVTDARFYRVTLESLDGEYTWSGTASSTALRLPETSEGPGDFTAAVKPFPEGLAPEGLQTVSFRRDGVLPFLGYRLSHLPLLSTLLLLLSVIFTGAAIWKRD